MRYCIGFISPIRAIDSAFSSICSGEILFRIRVSRLTTTSSRSNVGMLLVPGFEL